MPGHDEHPFRDLAQALAEAVFYRRAIFDPPPRDGWPARFRLRKVKR